MVTVAVVGAVISTGNTDSRHTVELVWLSMHDCTVDTLAGITQASIRSGIGWRKDIGLAELRNSSLDELCQQQREQALA